MRAPSGWLCTQANPVGMGIKVEKLFKQMHEAQEDVKTETLFAEVLRSEPDDIENWISLSFGIQGLLGLICEAEPLQIIEKTSITVGEGNGFDSLRRLQSNYNAKFALQGPNIYYEILVWSPDMGPRFGNKIKELEELIDKYRIITGKVIDENASLQALMNIIWKTEILSNDMKLYPAGYVTYDGVKRTLIEYSKTIEQEMYVKKSRQIGGLNALTPHWKRGSGRGRKGKDANKDKGSEKRKNVVCHRCQGYGHYASECTVYTGSDDGWGSWGKKGKYSSKK